MNKIGFVRSAILPWQSIIMVLTHGRLFLYSLIPWLFNCIIFAGLLFMSYSWSLKLARHVIDTFGDAWWSIALGYLAGVLVLLGAVGLQMILFTYVAMLLSGVFGEQLSYHTEHFLRGVSRPSPEGNIAAVFLRSVIEELKGILFFGAGFLMLFLLNLFIPVIGSIIFAVAAPIWTAFSLAFEFTAPTTERRGMHFREKQRFIFSDPLAALGFGLGILPMSLIPVLNFLFIPFAVVGGTQWFLMRETKEETNENRVGAP
ncbi:EI24 domain-containing protein [bacterium]|nr:EI24 domain-containing protein [candidate division CSSED10-310 bacterium]